MIKIELPNIPFRRIYSLATVTVVLLLTMLSCMAQSTDKLKEAFKNPPDSSRPGVYWYFMDGNLSREGMTKDLESMKEAGIGSVLFLEVYDGIPRGKVNFLSEEWQNLFKHAVDEAERLGIELTLGSGPGWAGSGGPWVKPEQSMRQLVASVTEVVGPAKFNKILTVPKPKKPFFGEGALSKSLKKKWEEFYEDVYILAFPTPEKKIIEDADKKAIYYRAPFSSDKSAKQFLPAPANFREIPGSSVDIQKIIDLTSKLQSNGKLNWDVPDGKWTIMRFVTRNNGAVTRPAPMPGLGFEIDKLDTTALNVHFDAYFGKLLKKVGPAKEASQGGWKMIHIDSWEMGPQNWSNNFLKEFQKRRAYDPLKFLPAYSGIIVGSLEMSERFLWDVRQTAMELVLENHAGHLKTLGHRNGFKLSIEPYDMNPTADLDLGAVADVPMGEFWAKGHIFNTSFSCIEAASIAHVHGRSVVGGEAFTSGDEEAWKKYPGNVKNQGDWAFCAGINKIVYHTFAHKALDDKYRPGMTMGSHGVHWDRGQTWWPMASAYHRYITRCQHVLRQGISVADILYLTPEGAPHVFRPPLSAMEGEDVLPDKRSFGFDGCSPLALIEKADVENGKIVFSGGTSYHVLVLPNFETMTPELLKKIESLLEKGAYVVGSPPLQSPSLVNYPNCDLEVEKLAKQIWGSLITPSENTEIQYGKGKIFWGGSYTKIEGDEVFPEYNTTATLLRNLGINEDFQASGSIRYIHRKDIKRDIYFISNRTGVAVEDIGTFNASSKTPELWNPVTGETSLITTYSIENGQTSIPLKLDKWQSFFIVFNKTGSTVDIEKSSQLNFPEIIDTKELDGSWELEFDTKWGGPGKTTFHKLVDWTSHSNEGIKYYSGIATYFKTFDLPGELKTDNHTEIYLDLGEVKNLARVKLNGKNLGVIWTSPWRVKITDVVKEKGNKLEIEIANLWGNRLIGDEQYSDDGIKNGKWPDWLLENKQRPSKRYTFTTWKLYNKDSPLQSSGLIGPVTIQKTKY